MPLQATSGAASYDAFGGGVAAVPNYIEDVFSTWLYTGTGATQTITNGIDLSGKGGLVWIKARSTTGNHRLFDTVRGVNRPIYSNLTNAQATESNTLTAFNANGFTLGSDAGVNQASQTWASWTFREQPKFFDCVTYTGNGTSQNIAHNLGSAPGCIIVKQTNTTRNWAVYHRSLGNDYEIKLNTTAAAAGPGADDWNFTTPTSTVFSVGPSAGTNASGGTYVAYLFAHNAGGFGLTGTDNVISCGSFTSSGSVTTVNLGYEPQWVLFKQTNSTGNWTIADNMRGMPASGSLQALSPNLSNAEEAQTWISTTSTGFTFPAVSGFNMIYIAIRRGPMKVPTTGTSVYTASTQGNAGDSKTPAYRTTFPVDFAMRKSKTSTSESWQQGARLTGTDELKSNSTAATVTNSQFTWDYNNGWYDSTATSTEYQGWNFRRAPSVFDVVCYTGTGANQTLSHNLQAVPELIICKSRTNGSASYNWSVTFNFGASSFSEMYLNATNAATAFTSYNTVISAQPSSTTFAVGSSPRTGATANNYVSYLFATCPGVSKVGSYTGNGTTQAIACGFTGGARFVLIKRTDSTGDWYVYDTARGMTVLTDPYLLMNSTAAETATLGSVITSTGGFTVNAAILAAINTNAASYIFLAIA
jgi:hypothetical protein